MKSNHSSREPPKCTDTSDGKDTGDTGETKTAFHDENCAFYFCGPQFILNSKGNALNLELDLNNYEDTQQVSDIPSSINVHPFHGGDTQQWLIHDDGNGGAAIMSKYNKKYVVPTDNGRISAGNSPYFWEISRDGTGYSFLLEPGHNLYICLINRTATLMGRLGSEKIYIMRSTPEDKAVILKSKAQLTDTNPAFPELAQGLPPCHILDAVATGRECSGFPTGYFRVRAAGTSFYWTLHCADFAKEGNALGLWTLLDEVYAQAFYIDTKGELSLCGGHIDVSENGLILTRTRAPTVPWPNPWSHPMPTFSYSKETKCIGVKFYADPCVPGSWPRAETEWKDTEFVIAAQCTKDVAVPKFNNFSRWAPDRRFITPLWTHHTNKWDANHKHTMGIETKPQLIDPGQGYPTRFMWELEEV